MLISLGSRASDAHPTLTECSWADLVNWLYSHPRHQSTEKDGPYICLAAFTPHAAGHAHGKTAPPCDSTAPYRNLGHLIASHGVPLDFDKGHVTADTIASTLNGYAYLAYTTHGHQPGAERWRVFVPVSTPMDAATHRATWEQLSAAFPGGADPAAKDASRLSYLPGACVAPDAARIFHADGAFFVPAQPVATVAQSAPCDHDGAVPGWNGPEDDETLLAIACTKRLRPDEAFGGAVHFHALWTGNEGWLATKYPPTQDDVAKGRAWNATDADMALAGELAFWTGSNRERMANLMRQSALATIRAGDEDWSERKVYAAVDRAIANAKQWYFMESTKPVTQLAVTIAEGAPPPPPPTDMTAQQAAAWNAEGALNGLNDYWSDHETGEFIYRPTGKHTPATVVDNVIGKDARMVLYSTRAVHGQTWAPGFPERFQIKEIDPTDDKGAECWLYNRYRAPKVPTLAGDVTPWLSLVQRLYPDDWQHIVRYFADAVQHPGRKCNHALVLGSGVHGIGKDTLLLPVRHAVGPKNYSVIRPGALTEPTNPWVASRVVHISESRDSGDGFTSVSRYEFYERCKDLAAAPPVTIEVNDKYIRKHQVLNVLRLVITTNHAVDGLYLDPEDRRHYCAWSDAQKMTEEEGAAIHSWYEAGGLDYVAHYLTHYDLDADGWNHAARPHQTGWWHLLVAGGRSAEDERFADALEKLGRPEWTTTAAVAAAGGLELSGWMAAPGNRRKVEREMDRAGYRRLANPAEPKRGRWFVDGKQVPIYRRQDIAEKALLAKLLSA